MNPAQRVIEKCGGFQAVAEMVRVHISRVHRWTYPEDRGGTGGFIPTRHQQTILAAARARGIGLKPSDFFEKSEEAESPPKKAASGRGR